MSVGTVGDDVAYRERPPRTGPDGDSVLVAPAAVRLLELDEPLADLCLAQARSRVPYRSVLLVVRLEGTPLGLLALPVNRDGWISRDRLAVELLRHPSSDVGDALVRRELDLPPPRTEERRLASPSVSVVVTTCRAPALLAPCLHSILASDYEDFEVIVVENRPGSPATRLMLADEFGPDQRVRYAEEPVPGLGSARNAGLMMAEGELVAFTDDDVVVDPGWISRSAEAFERADDVACVTGLILPRQLETDSQLMLEQFMALGKGFESRTYRLPESRATHPLLPYTPGVIGSGANTVLRADVARREGAFDPTLGTGTLAAGGEDLDLYIRLLHAGHAVAYEPAAIVWHAHPDGAARLRRQAYRYGVGLGATLTKQLVAGPGRLDLVRAVPAGIRYVRDPASEKNASKAAGFPRRLEWMERLGMAVGPVAYLTSALVGLGRQRPRPQRRTTAAGRVVYGQRLVLDGGQVVHVVEVAPERLRPAPRALASERAALTASFLTCLVLYAAGRLSGVPGLALAGAIGVLFLGVGTAPLQLSRTAALPVRLGVAGVVGLATLLLAGTAMVLAPLWDPDAAALVIVAAAGAVHLAALPSALADSRRSDTRAPTFAINPSSAAMLVGTSLWLGAAVFTPPIVPGIGGFPARITPLWHLGVVLVLFALVFAWRERQERYAALAVGSLMLALTLTPGLVYGMPRAQTAGKHVELVQLVLRSHHLRAGDGIYFAYSGFFDGIAWLCRVARVSDATGLATFWPALVGLLRLAELRFLFGRVIEERYRLWLAIALVVLVDAIGADYFSPQSVGYVLGLGIFALALAPGGRRALDPRLAAVLIILSGCALAVTHQLSPYIVGGVLLVLAAFGCARPRWAGLAILVPAGLWALLNRHALEGYFSLSSLGRISNFAPPHTAAAPGLSRDSIVGRSSNALTIGLVFLIAVALVGFARHRHERWARAFLISAGVGLVLVAVNPYGNEGIFRAALFGIPWLAILAAHAVRQADLLLVARWVALSLALFPTFLIAQFGLDASGVMRHSDLHALRVFEREAPPSAYLLQVGFGDLPNGPPNLPPTKHQIPFERVSFRSGLLPGRPDAGDLAILIRRYERRARGEIGDRAGPFYVLWSPVTAWYGREYGLETPAQTARWRDLLLASPSWRVVYREGGSYLFREDEPTRHGGPSP